MNALQIAAIFGMLLIWGAESTTAVAQADFVIFNARVYTMNEQRPRVEAIAVRCDRIVRVGSSEDVLGAYPDAEHRDAEKLTIVPGLIDAHAHLMGRGLSLLQADLVGTTSKTDVIERLAEFENTLPPGAWLRARGWDQNDWPDSSFPTSADLDAAFPDRPVWLHRIDGHAAWANTAAMKVVGIEGLRSAPDPSGGRILRDESGDPTGIFIDSAMDLISNAVPGPSPEERKQALKLVLEETARYGLTGIHDAGIDESDVELYREALAEGALRIRVYGMVNGRGATFDRFCEENRIFGDYLTVRSVKFYVDGALGSRGAALLEPYEDEPQSRGLLRTPADSFAEDVREAIRCGYQVNTHAIGDRGTRTVLDALESAVSPAEREAGRHRIEHAQIVAPEDIRRFRELSVIASMQPIHATSDMYWAAERVGRERLQGAYAWKSFLDEGVHLAFGSDFPVESVNPLLGFYAAVTRQDLDGYPERGWFPEQILTREEALHAFTIGAAYAAFQERDLGTIEPGKLADFVVLDRDIMSIPAEQIPSTTVVATYLGGDVIFDRETSVSDAE